MVMKHTGSLIVTKDLQVDGGITASGLPLDIHSRYSRAENDAIIAGTNVTVVSGANTITISSEGGGGGGTVSDAIIGGVGITVTSGTSETTIDGHEAEDAILGIDGVTITSGTNTITVSGTPITKTITIESPTAAEDITVFFVSTAVTIRSIRAVIKGGTSVTVDPRHDTDRTALGNQILTVEEVVTSTSTGQELTITGDTTIPADSWVWLETSGISGNVTELSMTFSATED